ncbi:von Willebrand factor A domain-containing protein 5A-like isoform X2 [Hyperolius riggenbachi]|uniref:von Willebrand factor A domain-containing protein 5A-like isoform X2 n=1 Tax=Hyperolius riggenbachi TaxID=752182 RepID=UPI0035A302CF
MPPFPICPPCCGLIIVGSRQPVPLQGIWVDVQVKGFVADVSATLKYNNKEENAVEAVFVFPMDEDSAVYSFEATIEGKKIVADLQEKKQARKTYEEAMSRGQQAFLLEEDESSADIFSCSVGNLSPGQEAEVTLKYVRELPVEADGAVRFVLPAVLNPRYTPKDQDVSVTATRPQVPVGSIPYTLTLNAQFLSTYGIAKIKSNCNITPVEYTDSDKTGGKVSLAEGHKFERDVELLAYYMDVYKPSVTVEAGLESAETGSIMADNATMLNFYPSFPAGQEQSSCGEFIFVVDRSGSMHSPMNSKPNSPQRIQSAKETLVLLMKSLPLGCFFNIYGFGSHFESFFPESVEYTQKSMEETVKKVNEMEADFGGTEILQPLQKIYKTGCRADHPRQLFVFTDGEVENTKQVITEVQKNAQKHRCFTFGIGEGASTSLIKGMARAGGGTAEFITGKDRMQPKVLRALKCSLQPSVKDVSLKWTLPPGVEASVLSTVPTSIFHGQKAIVYAQLQGKVEDEAEGEVSLEYKFKDEIVTNDLRFPLNIPKAERPTIHRLAAKALISELENGTEAKSEGVKKKILDTSLQSGVVSSLTAYVAVNKDTKTPVESTAVRRDIPAPSFMMRSGGAMPAVIQGSSAPMAMNRPMCRRSAPSPAHRNESSDSFDDDYDDEECYDGRQITPIQWAVLQEVTTVESTMKHGRAMRMLMSMECDDALYAAGGSSLKHLVIGDRPEGVLDMDYEPPPPPVPETPAMVKLVALQNAGGSWNLTPELSAILGTSEADIKAQNPEQGMDVSVWATVLAVIWLHHNCQYQKGEWELLEIKAVFWAKSKAGSSLGGFVKAANGLLKSSVDPKVFCL